MKVWMNCNGVTIPEPHENWVNVARECHHSWKPAPSGRVRMRGQKYPEAVVRRQLIFAAHALRAPRTRASAAPVCGETHGPRRAKRGGAPSIRLLPIAVRRGGKRQLPERCPCASRTADEGVRGSTNLDGCFSRRPAASFSTLNRRGSRAHPRQAERSPLAGFFRPLPSCD